MTSYGGATRSSSGPARSPYRSARKGRTSATAGPYRRLARMSVVADLAENRVVDGIYAVLKKEKLRTRGGASYLALELSDSTGRISGRVWSDVELLDARFAEGDAVHVLGRVERFRDKLQLEVRALEPAEADVATLAP